MSRERNAPAGRAAHPRPVGAPRAGSPPPPVPDALNHVPGHRKTERRKNNTPALGSGTGGIWFDALLFPSSFPAERNRRCGNGSACTSPPPPPPPSTPRGRDTKENTGLTPIFAWVFHAAPAPPFAGMRGRSAPVKPGLIPAARAARPAPPLLHWLSRWPCIFLLK